MFMGEYQHSLDAKSRIIIPSKFREELGSQFVMTKGFDHCLVIYSMEEWDDFRNQLMSFSTADRESRAFMRSVFSGAVECEFDKQGRLVIPQPLRDYAKIEKEVVTIGVLKKVEIWSKQEWDAYNNEVDLGQDRIAEKMAEFGL